MSAPEVTHVLDEIKTQWGAGTYGNIPLERVDRDESDQLDGSIRQRDADLQADNYVGASFEGRDRTPIGTEFDYDVESVVSVRVEGLHHTEYGKINPSNSLPPGTANDPVPFDPLINEIQDALQQNRTYPSVGRSDTTYTTVLIANEDQRSADYGDYYRADFDVLFRGYETPP